MFVERTEQHRRQSSVSGFQPGEESRQTVEPRPVFGMVSAAGENGFHGRGGFTVPGAGPGFGILRMPADRVYGSAPIGCTQQACDFSERNVVDTPVGPGFETSEFPPEDSRVIAAALPDIGAPLLILPAVPVKSVVLMPEHHPVVGYPEQVAVQCARFRRGPRIGRRRRRTRTGGRKYGHTYYAKQFVHGLKQIRANRFVR